MGQREPTFVLGGKLLPLERDGEKPIPQFTGPNLGRARAALLRVQSIFRSLQHAPLAPELYACERYGTVMDD